MNDKTPFVSSERQNLRFFDFLHISGKKRWDFVILGAVGVLVLGLFIYEIVVLSPVNTKIQYTPADIIYGEQVQAVHDMGANVYSQHANYSPASSTARPEIRLSEAYYDFGEVNGQQVLSRTFVIANSGQSPLIIQRAYTTCGCTRANFTAAEIPPGKVALMTLQFDTGYHDMRGTTVRRGVMIETNDPVHPTQEIWIQASIR